MAPSSSSTSNLLRILPDSEPLRGESNYSRELDWNQDARSNQPRALRSLSRIINDGLCHRCGSCVGICPTGVLETDGEEYPKIKNLGACTDCDLCVKVCPGDEFDINQHYQSKYQKEVDLKNTHGEFREALLAYSSDPDIREHSTSGGLVTAILLHMLETEQIDGALVIASDEDALWKAKPIVARTRDEILSAMKSKYAIAPTNKLFGEVLKVPGRYAMVGLPCQIHGFEKAASLDARIRERIVFTIGLYCHAAVEHDAFKVIWESLGEKADSATRFISRIGKHPGTPHLELKDGSMYPVYFGKKKGYRPSSMEIINIIYRLYTPARCLTCFDASAEFADIAVGDPWMAPPAERVNFQEGWSFALLRSERAQQICAELKDQGKADLEPITRKEALACNKMMSTEKRWRAFRIVETHRRQGKSIPAYGSFQFRFPSQPLKQFVKTELHMLTHALCFLPRFRASVLRFILSDGGYRLLWLNSLRRNLRTLIRDSYAGAKRAVFGRQ